jgi:hypothetical protein
MNVFLVSGLSKMVTASLSLATPPSVPENCTTIPDSSSEMLKSIWIKRENQNRILIVLILFTCIVFTNEITHICTFILLA